MRKDIAKDGIKTQFKPGQSGNPYGQPRKIPEIEAILAEVLGEVGVDGKTVAQEVLEAVKQKAKKGDMKAAEMILDRAYGKPKQTVDTNVTLTNFSIKEVLQFKEANDNPQPEV